MTGCYARTLATAVLLVLLPLAALCVDARLVVRMVQVAHRHGARGPLVTENMTEICGTQYPCGELTGNGIAMLIAVGSYARSRYNDPSVVESPLFPSTQYNSSVVYTRSTGIQRTIQSATAFLKGLFSNEYFFPVVYSHNLTTDTLLNTDPVPFVMGRRHLDSGTLNDVLFPVVDEYLTWREMQAAAKDGWIEGLCTSYADRGNCALSLYDVATAFAAAERLDSAPYLKEALPGLEEVSRRYYKYVFGWNDTSEENILQGSAAQNIAQTMLANMDAHRLSPSYKMFEYSTHDTMLAPLAVTFGDQSNTTMSPPYAVTIFVELLQDTEDPSGWYVRLIRGHPSRQANGNYSFTLDNITVHCIDAAGNGYLASTGICPLESFRRLVDSSRPAAAGGYCAITKTQYENLKCPVTIADGKPVPPNCWIYRYVCMDYACPPQYVLSASDFQCYPSNTPAASGMDWSADSVFPYS